MKKLGSLEQIMNKANLLVVAVALDQECKIRTREKKRRNMKNSHVIEKTGELPCL